MVQPIMKDVLFLRQKSEEATDKDKQIVQDLKDTLEAHRNRCVGMAANMIGFRKRIIIVSLGFMDMIMLNPVIIQKSQPYDTEDGFWDNHPVPFKAKLSVKYDDQLLRYRIIYHY